jgi:hypothetical protein
MANWNWWPQFHDPSLRLSWREQAVIHWDANLRMLRDWRACWRFIWISVLPVPLLVAALAVAMEGLQVAIGGTSATQTWLLLGLLLLAAYLFLQHIAFMVAMRRGYLPFVREALSARGYPTCTSCGHLLGPTDAHTAPGDVLQDYPRSCPECGSGNPALR